MFQAVTILLFVLNAGRDSLDTVGVCSWRGSERQVKEVGLKILGRSPLVPMWME